MPTAEQTTASTGPARQAIPAAVTAQAVSAAGTSRRSTAGVTHTVTNRRSFSSRAGPIPSTSAS